jgi:peptidyl-tRNA hydrolase, PTH1 family
VFWKKAAPGLPPEWLIVGLGNPGGEYRGTRHNVGFEVIDRLAESHRIKVGKAKHRAITGLGKINEATVLLVKPLTYMNLSGQSVAPLAKENQLKPENVFVVADDLDLPVGKLRIKLGGSAGGHNGHKSIIAALRSDDYPRLKIGIGKTQKDGTVDHVLGSFDRDEREVMDHAIRTAVKACEALARGGIQAALKVVEEYNHGKD